MNATSSSSSAITNLPSHILAEILLRLPIRTVVASTCVCKSWLLFVKDPQFSKQHQARKKVEVCFQSYYDKITKLYMGNFHSHPLDIKLDALFHFPEFVVMPDNVLKYGISPAKPHFVDSCNGLLCYSGHQSSKFALIWNPITSEFITFPAPKTQQGLSKCCAYGLGFSQKANRFKLLRLMGRKENELSEEVLVVEMCTIERESSWRTLGRFPWASRDLIWDVQFIEPFLQGALHWVGPDYADSSSSDMIMISFNFDDEKFGQVPLPPCLRNQNMKDRKRDYHFGVLDGCLFIAETTTKRGTNIWLMKEYGVQDSWTQVFSMEYSRCVPISYMDSGEILMRRTWRHNTDLFLYNPVLKSTRVLGSGPDPLTVIAFNPSLIRLKDSMMGYGVHVKPRCANSENREITTTPSWWRSMNRKANSKNVRDVEDGDGEKQHN